MLTGFRAILTFLTGIGLVIGGAVAANAEDIDLKLFGKNVIEGYDGCHLGFWQRNRNPDKDEFAYVFFAPFNDGEMLPAWMKVGEKVLELDKVEIGAASRGKLDRFQLYRTADGTLTALLEIRKQRGKGANIAVGEARFTLIQRKKFPFVITVEGRLQCPDGDISASSADAAATGMDDISDPAPKNKKPRAASRRKDKPRSSARRKPKKKTAEAPAATSANLPGDAISLGLGIQFESLDAVPREMRRYIGQNIEACELDTTAGIGARYAISDAMTLWEIPCALFASQGTSVYAAALNDNPEQFAFLAFPVPPGEPEGGERYDMMSPTVSVKDAIVTSMSLGQDGSCGIYERHQLRAVEGEAVEFVLLEYREKPDCDGFQADPKAFPLVYSAK